MTTTRVPADGTTPPPSLRLMNDMLATTAIQDDKRRYRRVAMEDPVRAAFKFVSITVLSLFMAMAVVQVVVGQPQRTDHTLQQLEEIERLTGYRPGPIF